VWSGGGAPTALVEVRFVDGTLEQPRAVQVGEGQQLEALVAELSATKRHRTGTASRADERHRQMVVTLTASHTIAPALADTSTRLPGDSIDLYRSSTDPRLILRYRPAHCTHRDQRRPPERG
jgi:hypothetical protein